MEVEAAPIAVGVQLQSLATSEREAVMAALDRARGLEVSGRPVVLISGPPVDPAKELAIAPTVVVLADDRRSEVATLLRAGAAGVLPAAQVDDGLEPVVVAVAAGFAVVPADQRALLTRPSLTNREREVLSLLVMGLTNATIGQRLFLAESTVKYHLLSIYGKLGVRSRKEAIDLVLDPRSGLDAGVLGLRATPRRGKGYSGPTVR